MTQESQNHAAASSYQAAGLLEVKSELPAKQLCTGGRLLRPAGRGCRWVARSDLAQPRLGSAFSIQQTLPPAWLSPVFAAKRKSLVTDLAQAPGGKILFPCCHPAARSPSSNRTNMMSWLKSSDLSRGPKQRQSSMCDVGAF